MPITHVYSQTVADGTATSVVRPSDWNSAHGIVYALSSNTAGSSRVSGLDVTFVGSGNLTLSADTAASKLVFSGGTQSVQTQNLVSIQGSTGAISFGNANGVTFGFNASTVTASVSQTVQPVAVSGQNGSYAFSTLSFSNANGVSFGTSGASAITASHNGLTTARASNDGVGLATAQTNVTWTVNSGGLSINAAGYAGTVTGATNANVTANSNGVSVSVPAQTVQPVAVSGQNGSYAFSTLSFSNANGISFGTSGASAITASHNALTTARASNDAIGLNTAQTNVTWTVNSNGLSINAGGYAGTQTGATNANVTANSNGISVSVTAPLLSVSAYAFSNTTQSSTGTMALSSLQFAGAGIASVGVTGGSVVVSVPSGGGAGDGVVSFGMSNLGNTAGTSGTVSSGQAVMVGSGPISLSQSVNGQSLTLSVLGPATSSLSGVSPITIQTAGSTISVGYSANALNYYRAYEKGNNTSFSSLGQNTLNLQHFIPDDPIQFSNIELFARGSFVSSSNSQAYSHTISYGLYSQDTGTNSTRMTLMGSSTQGISASYSSNLTYGFTIANGVTSYTTTSAGTAVVGNISGPFIHALPFTTTLNPNVKYALAINISSTTAVGTSPFRYAPLVQTVMNSLSFGRLYNTTTVATGASNFADREMAVLSATTGAMPASYATSQLTVAVSRQQLPFNLTP